MKFYNAGYLIISYDRELINKGCMITDLSQTILTICNGVRPTFPDYWFFPWCNSNKNDPIAKVINGKLKISKEEHESGQTFLDTLMEEAKFAWPNVFKDLEDARFFKQNYLKGIENLEIISLNLSEEYRTDFLMNEREENDFKVSIYDFLESSLPTDVKNNEILGFDICGYESNGFYSFIFNNLQVDFKTFDKRLNDLSLVDKYEDAKQIIHSIDDGEIEAEEVLWYPWLIVKCV
ncbi:hypothetical protein CN639_08460 [Bacillus toyonensis]|uniref:Uncharacterized protein n=1 Tax=Bacillus toyonensis TaxID=155322 RepID=A0AB36T828_9BACI|nr:hypothetical protein [Bacillus toyonensis]PKR91905.1 hypothetical protein bcere0024_056170 [Bacillus cereus Rock4-18]PEC08601.1 hypothetical protein CON55_22350 [Bacillus toyonensis]PEJ65274.1 hypothetical protein CN906_07770 [Bacillus toyonensis]PEK48411.1 hypothetical protein CN588_13885 [Bacillus toyonensis]PEM91946.1 hypothetical protein CN639_08460 [Bacillus toyonensis]